MQEDLLKKLKQEQTDLTAKVDQLNTLLKELAVRQNQADLSADELSALFDVIMAQKKLVDGQERHINTLEERLAHFSKKKFDFWDAEVHARVVNYLIGNSTFESLKNMQPEKTSHELLEYVEGYRAFCRSVLEDSKANLSVLVGPTTHYAYFKQISEVDFEFCNMAEFDTTVLQAEEFEDNFILEERMDLFDKSSPVSVAAFSYIFARLFPNIGCIDLLISLLSTVLKENKVENSVGYLFGAYFLLVIYGQRRK